MKKLFIQTFFILSCFLFFLAFFSKPVMALCAGWSGSSCSCPGQAGCTDWGAPATSYCACKCGGQCGAPAPTSPPAKNCGSIGGNACSWSASNAQPPNTCTSLGNTYDCSPCLVCSAPAPTAAPKNCGSIGGNACSWSASNAQPPNTCTSLGNTYDCSPCLKCSAPVSCGNSGGTDCTKAASRLQTGHWYCHSLGNTYDCTGNGGCLRCSTGTDVCPGSPPPPPACSCSTSYGACNVGCPVGQKKKIVSCNRSGCGEGTNCVADSACNPTCTISLSPSSLNLQVGDSALLTANVSVQNSSVSRVNFTSVNLAIASLNPTYVSSAPYTIAVYGNSVGSTTITAQALLSPSGSCSTPTSVPVSVEAKGWFQTQGGDIYTGGNLSDGIPETATDRNLSLKLNNWPGVIAHQDTNGVNLGSGFSSNDTVSNWLSLSEYQGKVYGSFQFFKKKFATQMATENYSSSNGVNAPSEDKVYYAKSSRTLSGNWSLGNNRWIVLLVEGDVSINTNIIVPKGSFLAIATTGSIVFNSSVTKAQGMFVADNRIDTSSGAIAFEGQGTFTAPQVIFGRDFKDSRNQTTSVEKFIARPDFIMSSYKDADNNLWYFNFLWKELAP